jgi:hypothetical protein
LADKRWLAPLALLMTAATSHAADGLQSDAAEGVNADPTSEFSIEFNTAPPAGLSCLNGAPDFGASSATRQSNNGVREECYVTEAYFVVLRRSAQGEGYSVSLQQPPQFDESMCEAIEVDIKNCINVLPGRSHAYVEAALGIEAPTITNYYRWHGQAENVSESAKTSQGLNSAPVTSVTLEFSGDTLSVMDVFISTPE